MATRDFSTIQEKYLAKLLNGKAISTTLVSKDTYNAMTRIIRKGTGPAKTINIEDNKTTEVTSTETTTTPQTTNTTETQEQQQATE